KNRDSPKADGDRKMPDRCRRRGRIKRIKIFRLHLGRPPDRCACEDLVGKYTLPAGGREERADRGTLFLFLARLPAYTSAGAATASADSRLATHSPYSLNRSSGSSCARRRKRSI